MEHLRLTNSRVQHIWSDASHTATSQFRPTKFYRLLNVFIAAENDAQMTGAASGVECVADIEPCFGFWPKLPTPSHTAPAAALLHFPAMMRLEYRQRDRAFFGAA